MNQESKISAIFKFNTLTALQLFQLFRYGAFIMAGIGFAKLHLSPGTIGTFETFVMVSGMVTFFWVSALINSMLAQYPRLGGDDKKKLLFNTYISLIAFAVLAAGFLWLFSPNVLAFLNKSQYVNLPQLCIIYLLLGSPAFIVEYIFYLHQKKYALLGYGIISALATLAAALLPMLSPHNGIIQSVYGVIVVAAARFIFSLSIIGRYATLKPDFKLLMQNLRLSLPLMGSIFVSGSAEYIDGIIIKARFDDVGFAVYRYGAKELPVLLILANTLSSGMVAAISADLQKGLAELKARSLRLMHLFFPLTIVLLLGSDYLYRFVFSDTFVYSALIFNVYLLLVIPRLLFPQAVLTGLQHTGYQLLSSIIEITLNISLSIYLAGKIGLPGVAAGTLVAYTVDKVFLIAVNRLVFKVPLSRYLAVLPFAIYSTLTVLAFCLAFVIRTA